MSTKLTLKQFRQLQNAKKASPKRKQSKKIGMQVSRASAPLSVSVHTKKTSPVFKSTRSTDGRITVVNREFISDVVPTQSTFQVQKVLPINPGNEDFGRWISISASAYESHKFKKLWFEYKPLVPATVQGAVYLAVDYDSKDSAPSDKITMMSYQGAERVSLWEDLTMKLDRKDMDKLPQRYNLDDLPPVGTDIRLYNLGNLIVATDGVSSSALNTAVGEIYCNYEVELMTPQTNVQSDGSISNPASNVASNPFATQTSKAVVGKVIDIIAPNIIRFLQTGRFALDMKTLYASGITATPPVIARSIAEGNGQGTITGEWGNAQYQNGQAGLTNTIANITQAPCDFTVDFSSSGVGPITNTAIQAAVYKIGQLLS